MITAPGSASPDIRSIAATSVKLSDILSTTKFVAPKELQLIHSLQPQDYGVLAPNGSPPDCPQVPWQASCIEIVIAFARQLPCGAGNNVVVQYPAASEV